MSNSWQKTTIKKDVSNNSLEITGSNGLNQVKQSNENIKPENSIIVNSVVPKERQQLLKWNGWGYNDSKFAVKNGIIHFTGTRYPIGNLSLPYFTKWAKDVFALNFDEFNKPQELPDERHYPAPMVTKEILDKIDSFNISSSTKVVDRLFRAHGHTLHDIYTLRMSKFERIPDLVVWPKSHEDVVKLVNYSNENNLVIIPFGGGTSVTSALQCPGYESRTIISLDTSQMNKILWVDRENLVVCCESGIIGQDLERELQKIGFTTGHEPDSYEFSSLGGWVATRASGMKKNTYGNIEDLLVHVKMVTPKGVLQKNCQVPRLSCGPDFHHVILGSEGTLGVVTEVILKVRPVPKFKKYGSVVFPNFESGVKCMREVARRRCQPSSIRLMDNDQFQFGQALRPQAGYFGLILDGLKRIYITKIKGFDVNSMCVMTLLFEGDQEDVAKNEKNIYEIAGTFGGIPAGEKNGERGYLLTFVIAYIRDLALEYYVVAESFETSVPWDRTIDLCRNVKFRVVEECKRHGVTHFLICSRVTQTYDAGSVVYFYFGFNYKNIKNPVEIYEEIESRARDEIVANGGSISHHHGVGKIRKKWYARSVSDVGVALYAAAKRELDPNNVFASDNLINSKL